MKRLHGLLPMLAALAALVAGVPAKAGVIVELPLDAQIDIGLGPAITGFTSFESEGGVGFVRKYVTPGGWYFGPAVDLVKAGYGPWVDLSIPGTQLRYRARYFQGGGNPNPYGDAPIFVVLRDVNGKSGGLGISYGPRPDPVFPGWAECVDSATADHWPLDPDFDPSRVVAIEFFGTDWSGTGDDFIDIRDLRIVTPRLFNPIPLCEARTAADGVSVETSGFVTAVFTAAGRFYIQQPGQYCAIQVRAESLPEQGSSVALAGTLGRDEDTGERYIQAEDWAPLADAVTVKPLHLKASALGGAATPWQAGLDPSSGPNNVGLLVELTGLLVGKELFAEALYLDDCSGVADGPGGRGVRVDCSWLATRERPYLCEGERLTIRGISSLHREPGGRLVRALRPSVKPVRENFFSEGNEPVTIRALVVNFDPRCPAYGNLRTHEVFGWYNPPAQIQAYIRDLREASGGWCNYVVVDWIDADYHPYFEDGFTYDPDEYVFRWNNRDTVPLHPGTMDYIRLVTDRSYPHNQPRTIAERVASGEVDEVFLFGAPAGMAGWEAAMAGPSPFFVNGGTYHVPSARRNFVLMGFNYERDVDCMLEDFLHRTECVLSRVYSPPQWWFPTWPVTNDWDRFRMFDLIRPGEAAVGICHYAPNSLSDYDWGNPAFVWSMCDDWRLNWPGLVGAASRRLVNHREWGSGDPRLHHLWWLEHLPRAPGVSPEGRQNNWWKYTCTFNDYPESR